MYDPQRLCYPGRLSYPYRGRHDGLAGCLIRDCSDIMTYCVILECYAIRGHCMIMGGYVILGY